MIPEIVLACCFAAIVAVLLLFIRPARRSRTVPQPEVDEMVVEVGERYRPEVVILRKGVPAKLRFVRADAAAETDEVFFPWFHVHRKLPPLKTTTIDLQADEAGEYEFHSRTGVIEGRLVVLP